MTNRFILKRVACPKFFCGYNVSVKKSCASKAVHALLGLVFFFFFGLQAEAAPKIIHLRNKSIVTEKAHGKTTASTAADARPVSGLFLIQFTGTLQADWRGELQREDIKLLRYVPDDAFIARLKNASVAQIQSLPFVQSVEPYRAEYKIHSSLKAQADQRGVAPKDLEIRALLSPDATPQELAAARGILRKVEKEHAMRFGNILQGTLAPKQLNALADSPTVLWIEPAPKMKLFDEIASKITGGDDGEAGTPTLTQQLGYDGSGITVSVADSGLMEGDAETMHPDLAGRVDAFFYYGNLEDAADEHSHGTHVTGIIAGNAATGETDDNGYLYGLGVAPGSHIIAQRIFDGEGVYEPPPSYETLTHDAVRSGADIGSNSWGDDTQGRYDLSAAEFDALVRDADSGTPGDQPYILEFSAGNAGPAGQTIGSPAVAKNVIASGAVENNRFDLFIYDSGQETMADFSSRGPCEDGRIKPDVVAPGTWIASLRSSVGNDENAWADISANYMYQGGTSQSGPHVSGAAAVFAQYYKATVTNAMPSPALVKAALINSSVDMDDEFGGTEPVPNNDEGWGRVDLSEMIGSSRDYQFVDQSVLMTNGQVFEKKILIASPDEPLKITLAYTDVPALPASLIALVNDLDLEVVAPNGIVYRGNQFLDGNSVPNAPSFDRINNVEAVHLKVPAPGEYVIRVYAHNIAEDARVDTAALDQDFALVVSGDLPFPGQGVLFFDRNSYRAPDVVNVSLIDFDLMSENSVAIQIKSTTESAGKTLTLSRVGPGSFRGNIATVTGAAGAGQLRVAHGDTITANYQDTSPPALLTATARVDLNPPVLTGVSSTNRFGRTIISWHTDEPANSIVRYGTNTLALIATNSLLTTSHEIILDDLVAAQTYQFIVISVDEAGNAATNDNGGAQFSFTAEPPASALLVNAYTYDSQWEETPEIPLSTYTDALDQTGIGYEVWNVTEDGPPQFADLKPYRAVIWRVNDSFWNYFYDTENSGITPSEQAAITSYLTNGGALFMSSMEILSRLGDVPFRTNVLHVGSFQEDVGLPFVEGASNDPVTSGLNLELDYSAYPNDEDFGVPQDLSDTIIVTTNATAILFDLDGEMAGVRFPQTGQDSSGRVVFLPFPLDVVSSSDAAPNNRASLLRNVLNFLIPGFNGAGSIAFSKSEFTVPSVATVEVADSDLTGLGTITILAASDSMPSGQTITLNETVRPGLFRGSISLVGSTDSLTGNELIAVNGDQIWAEYFDESQNHSIRTYATIDTVAPTIANIAVVPDYLYSVVSWDTSKPTDALVQFGESILLNRTAYDPNLSETHELIVDGLQANKTYFYQVVSRDNAGNTVIDDNNGQFYTFHTLTPFYPPWTDNLEGDTSRWQVVTSDGSQVQWELGPPNNGVETEAHSPTRAWGSNLNGQSIDQVETWLFSPAVQLPSDRPASLHFWQSYDFPEIDVLEGAELSVTTDGGKTWTALKDYTDSSFGWEEEVINLSPYRGQVVQFSWYYVVFSLEGSRRPGWLIDDISVTDEIDTPFSFTSLTFTNGQAQFTFSAPAGSYVIEGSTDLVNWVPLQTNNSSGSEITFIDIQSTNFPARFYRLRK